MEKKVTEGPSRVGIVSKSWFPRTRPDLPHRVWVAEGWSSAPAWVSAVEAQTGLAARLPVKREPQYRPPEELPHGSFVWGHPATPRGHDPLVSFWQDPESSCNPGGRGP